MSIIDKEVKIYICDDCGIEIGRYPVFSNCHICKKMLCILCVKTIICANTEIDGITFCFDCTNNLWEHIQTVKQGFTFC